MTRAAIYARLSEATSSTESDSIANQVAALTKLAKREGYELVHTFTDDGKSAFKKVERPGFLDLLAAIKRGEIDMILVRHVDRLERNDEDATLIRVFSAANGVKWQTLGGDIIDTAEAGGSLMAKITSAIGQYESQVRSERLRMRYAAQTAKGQMLAPKGTFGYDDDDRTLTLPWEAAEVLAAYQAVDTGRTVGSIVRDWNKRGIEQRKGASRWTYAHLNAILKRHRNAGIVVDREGTILEGITGQWEPIVSRELFDRVNFVLSDPARRTSPGYQPIHLSSGIASCGVCGAVMISSTVSDKAAGTRYKVLLCSSPDKVKTERHVTARIADLDPAVRGAVIDAFAYGPQQLFPTEDGVDVGGLQKVLNYNLARQGDLLDLLREGIISKPQATAQLALLKPEEQEVRARLEDARASSTTGHMLIDLRSEIYVEGKANVGAAVELKKELGKRFDALHIEQQRRLVRQLLDIRILRGRIAKKFDIKHLVVTSLNA